MPRSRPNDGDVPRVRRRNSRWFFGYVKSHQEVIRPTGVFPGRRDEKTEKRVARDHSPIMVDI